MRTIAVINQKGGVGKTTTAVNLGHALSLEGKRIVLIDMDPQSHLAPCLGIFRPPEEGLDRVLMQRASLQDVIFSTRELLQLVPAGKTLGEFERQAGDASRAFVLKEALANAEIDADYVILDCPPSAGLLVVNAVLACDEVLVPVAGDYLSLTGLAKLMETIGKIERLRSQPLAKWVFLSRFIARRRLSQEVQEKLLHHFPNALLETQVSEAAVLAECAGAGRTVFEYRAKSKSAQEFRQLADDLVQGRVMNHEQQQTSHVA